MFKKNLLKVFALVTLSLVIVGCGCENKTKDNQSSSDKKIIKPDQVSRDKMDFEKLNEKITGFRQDNDYYYEVIVYYENTKAKNSVMTIVCPDKESAKLMYEAMKVSDQNADVDYNEKTVVYTYNENYFPFKGLSKEETRNNLLAEGFTIK